jgi:TolB-like protein
MRRVSMVLLSLAAVMAAGTARADEDLIRIAVVDFANRGADENLVKDCNSRVNSELHKLGVFKVTSKDDIRAMLSHEKEKALLGCEDASCLAEIGGALGVEYLVTGSVSKLDARTTIDLRLVNIRKGSVDNVVQQVVDKGTASDVVDRAGDGAVSLISKLFASKQGFLALVCDEAGATVKIDGAETTTTPVRGRLTLPFGPHLVEVSKTGFLTWRERLTLQPNQGVEKDVSMVPSPDFIESYESSNSKIRTGAWIATVVAVAGAGAGGYFAIDAGNKYDKFKVQKAALEQNPRDATARNLANTDKTQVQSADQISLIAGGVALLSAGIATWLWIAGDNPDRYAKWRVEPSASTGAKSDGKTSSALRLDPGRMALSFP